MIKPDINIFSAYALALLLILTAWGNAYAFLVFGVLALCGGFIFFQLHAKRAFVLAMSVSAVISIVAGVLLFFIAR